MSEFLKPENAQIHLNNALKSVNQLPDIPEKAQLKEDIQSLSNFIGGEPELKNVSDSYWNLTRAILAHNCYDVPDPKKPGRTLQLRNSVGGVLTQLIGSLNGLTIFLNDEGDDFVDAIYDLAATIAPKFPVTEADKATGLAKVTERTKKWQRDPATGKMRRV